MRLFSSYFPKTSRSADIGTPPPENDFWYSKISRLFGVNGCSVRVDANSALGLPAVFACVRVLAYSAAQIPIITYELKGNQDRDRATKSPISRLMKRPNKWQYHFKWMNMMFGHLLLRGNCYCQIVRDRAGVVQQLIPLHPARVTVEQLDNGNLRYIVDAQSKERETFKQNEIFHCTALTMDGLVGLSPISVAQRVFEQQAASKEYRARFYENSAQPSGLLKMPGALKDQAAIDRLKKTWSDAHVGVKNAHKIAILEQGLEWQQIGLSSKDNDFVNEERLGLEDVARMFGVPPHKIGDLSRSTNNNIEHQSIEFVRDCLTPWLKNFEEALMFSLLTEKELEKFYIEFLVDGLLRGDYKTRQEGLAVQRQNGVISANEWRKLENMNALPSEEGDVLLVNGNMIPVKDAKKPQEGLPAGKTLEADPEEKSLNLNPLKRAHENVIGEIITRLERKFEKWEESNHQKPNYSQIRSEFVQNHCKFMSENLYSAAYNYRMSLFFAERRASVWKEPDVMESVRDAVDCFCDSVVTNETVAQLEDRVKRYSKQLMEVIENTLEEA